MRREETVVFCICYCFCLFLLNGISYTEFFECRYIKGKSLRKKYFNPEMITYIVWFYPLINKGNKL